MTLPFSSRTAKLETLASAHIGVREMYDQDPRPISKRYPHYSTDPVRALTSAPTPAEGNPYRLAAVTLLDELEHRQREDLRGFC